MKINKKTQYGLMFTLYLARAGRATVEDASHNLLLSKSFLEQVARRLRLAGVISSVRGPGGGYELKTDARMMDVFNALSPVSFISKVEYAQLSKGMPEARALAHYSQTLNLGVYPVLNRKVRSVMSELVANEMVHLNRLDVNGLEQ